MATTAFDLGEYAQDVHSNNDGEDHDEHFADNGQQRQAGGDGEDGADRQYDDAGAHPDGYGDDGYGDDEHDDRREADDAHGGDDYDNGDERGGEDGADDFAGQHATGSTGGARIVEDLTSFMSFDGAPPDDDFGRVVENSDGGSAHSGDSEAMLHHEEDVVIPDSVRLGGDEDDGASSSTSSDDSEMAALLLVWERAPKMLRYYSVLDPSVCETMAQPSDWLRITRAYQVLYFLLVLYNTMLLLLFTFRPYQDQPYIVYPLLILQGLFLVDFGLRIATFPAAEFLPMIVVDFLAIICTFICVLHGDSFLPEIIFVALLRGLRLFLVTRLFIRTETFRDINLALRTFEESFKPLMIFVILMGVALCLFATFVFIAERGSYDTYSQLWYRPCTGYQPCAGPSLSPFQSIPDALWLVFQSMTTEGYGDAVPTTTWGRTVTGASIICGVFVIAFPSMVLIGNLDATRRDFFEREELEELNRAYGIGRDGKRTATVADPTAAEDPGADDDEFVASKFHRTMTFADAMHLTMKENVSQLMNDEDILFATIPGMRLDSTSSSSHNGSRNNAVKRFAFMGNANREITHLGRGEYTYTPLFAILCDPSDRMPIVSCVAAVPGRPNRFTCVLTLVIDDVAAQAAASEAIVLTSPGGFAHSHPIYALEVTMKTTIAGVRLRRRCDIGEVRDSAVPLTLEVRPPQWASSSQQRSREEMVAYAEGLRKQLVSCRLRMFYATKPYSAAIWAQSVPITSVMLASTPFIVDLKEIAVNVSIASLWTDRNLKEGASDFAQQRRNLAYIAERHMEHLIYPVYKRVIESDRDIIRNGAEFMRDVVDTIALHCRCIRKIDIAPEMHRAIYQNETVGVEEALFEVDVDYFQSQDWPLGVATAEFSERPVKVETIITCGDSAKLEQPEITDLRVFQRATVDAPLMPRPVVL